MDQIMLAIFVFVFIVVITSLVFGGWIIVSLLRNTGRFLGMFMPRTGAPSFNRLPGAHPGFNAPRFVGRGPASFAPPMFPTMSGAAQICSFPRCKASNPLQARFCRRCGRQLQTATAIARERIAV